MASVLFKNAPANSAYSGLFAETYFIRPPQDVDGICPAVACAQNERTLAPFITAGTATELGTNIGGIFYANYPFAPDFTCPSATDVFSYEINGWDHFGNPIQELGTKNGTGASNLRARAWRVFSAISSVYITLTTAGPVNIEVGFSYAATATAHQSRRYPLPFALNKSIYAAKVVTVDIGGQTAPAAQLQNVGVNVLGGALDTAAADTVFALQNTGLWTPNRLAQVGVVTVNENPWTAGAANTAPSTMRVMLTPNAIVGV